MIWHKLEKCRIWDWTEKAEGKHWLGSLCWGPTTIGVELSLEEDGSVGLTVVSIGDTWTEEEWVERAKRLGAPEDLAILLGVMLGREVYVK